MERADHPTSPLLRYAADESGRVEMMCPRCREWQDTLAFKTPEVVAEFAASLNPILKCSNGRCRHVFSPRWLAPSSAELNNARQEN